MSSELDKLVGEARRESFRRAGSVGGNFWWDRRPLSSTELPEGYNELLPTWRGKSFVDVVEDRVASGLAPVRILDVGCGPIAQFLQDCKQRWGGAVECYGINAEVEESADMPVGVEIIQGDVQTLGRYYQPESMDVAVSVRTFLYLADPWATLEFMHTVLRTGGVGLITDMPLTPLIEGLRGNKVLLQNLVKFMEDNLGMEVKTHIIGGRNDGLHTECNVSFEKDGADWSLPVSYSGRTSRQIIEVSHIDEIFFPVLALTYLVNENLLGKKGGE